MKSKSINKNYYLNLYEFKKIKCTKHCIKNKNSTNKCFNYHNHKDKIRSFKMIKYFPDICINYSKKDNSSINCIKREKCNLCHNQFELNYHPFNYKTKFCKNIDKCKLNKMCPWAHNEFEIKIKPIYSLPFDYSFFVLTFKTIFCPIPNGYKHLKKTCIFAHNYQDIRRAYNPLMINEKCKQWKSDKFDYYGKYCLYKWNCNYSHSIKENHYHQNYYKTIKCTKEDCKSPLCIFIHNQNENKTDFKNNMKINCLNVVPKKHMFI